MKVQFRLSTGTVTVPHIIAAGGDVQLLVAAEHWLNVTSGGLPTTQLAAGGQEFSLRELDVAMFQMVKLDGAVLGRTIRSMASSFGACGRETSGMPGRRYAVDSARQQSCSDCMLGFVGTSMCKAPPSAVAVGSGTYDGFAAARGGDLGAPQLVSQMTLPLKCCRQLRELQEVRLRTGRWSLTATLQMVGAHWYFWTRWRRLLMQSSLGARVLGLWPRLRVKQGRSAVICCV